MTVRIFLPLGLVCSTLLATSALAADYNGFVDPTSLGQSVSLLNSKYQLTLEAIHSDSYKNSDTSDCGLYVLTDNNNLVTSISISPNTQACNYNVASSGVSFDSSSTTTVDILNQVKLEDIYFVPGCFNCPSRIELNDNLVIKRPQDNYYTEVGIDGYNSDYLQFMATKLFGNYHQDNYYPMMDKLEKILSDDPSLYQRKDFKLKAINTYSLNGIPWSYTITLE